MDGYPSVIYFAMSWLNLHWYFVETRRFFVRFAGRNALLRSIASKISFNLDWTGKPVWMVNVVLGGI
jgi:hypothetical protein